MTFFFRHLIFLILMLAVQLQAQNLVPNGSFEEYVDCPIGLPDLQAVGWFQARGTCDYYNACAEPGGVSVPWNVLGWQEALTGDAYAGLLTFRTQTPNEREHLGIEIMDTLVIGEKYFLAYYVSAAFNGIAITKVSNGHGALLSTRMYNAGIDQSPLFVETQMSNLNVIEDTLNWTKVSGNFIADSSYKYLYIGSFISDLETDTSSIIPGFQGHAYYYIDEIRLSTDSIYVNIDLITAVNEEAIDEYQVYPNPTFGRFFITSRIPIVNVQIFDMNGSEVLQLSKSDIISVDLTDLANGMYVAVLEDNTKRKSHVKVIKYH